MQHKQAIMTEPALQSFIGILRKAYKESGYIRAQFSDEKPRSLSQNALAAVWYEQVFRELGEQSPLDVKCFCKLHIGIPILRGQDEDFRNAYDLSVKKLPYEAKLKAMIYFPVTSLMSTRQLSSYLESMKSHFDGRVNLEWPEDYFNK